jgi:hypothetical protein
MPTCFQLGDVLSPHLGRLVFARIPCIDVNVIDSKGFVLLAVFGCAEGDREVTLHDDVVVDVVVL